jgi:hypothetical protein
VDPGGREAGVDPGVGQEPQAAADLWQLSDLCTPWCLRVVSTLRIAELMERGLTATAELAAAAGCDPLALAAVLAHLAGRGVFVDEGDGRFGLNAAAAGLTSPALHLGLDLEGIGGRMTAAWATLPSYVRTGRSAYAEIKGLGFWEDLAAHPEVAASFDELMGMAGHGRPAIPPLTGGWEAVERVVDVGGGTGAMLTELLGRYPHLTGTLVDLPGTVSRAGPVLDGAGVAARVTVCPQSFFDPLPAGADVYLLCKVLNDWPDAETLAILRRCAEAAAPAGRVLVSGDIVAEHTSPTLAIDMVVAGGRSVSEREFRDQAGAAGLEVVTFHHPPAGGPVAECRRAPRP